MNDGASTATSEPISTKPMERAGKRGLWGWMFFDWAAQPFFTVVTTFIFGPYVVSRLADDPATGQSAWAFGVAAAGLIIAVLSPVLGSIADQSGRKKPWIAGFAVLKVAMLLTLWFAAPGASLVWVVAAFAIATIAAEFSIVFNDSMLPRIATAEQAGRVSNTAWGLGYAGGLIVLAFTIALLAANPESGRTLIGIEPLFGLDPAEGEDARITGPMAAIWYLIFILPMFLFTPDAKRRKLKLGSAVRGGLAELRSTWTEVKRQPGIARFLAARMIYQDGVNALIALGGTYAAALFLWPVMEIGIFGIILNLTAIPGCLLAARLDKTLGSKKLVIGSVCLLFIAALGIVSTKAGSTLFGVIPLSTDDSGGLFGTAAEKAYILYGLLIGLTFGPVQASSRAWMARSVPEEEAGRWFGFYALSGRATSFLAPLLVGIVTTVSGSAALGMSVILLFLIIGFAIAVRTPYPAADPQTLLRIG
ncbi:MFS transporter [Notoacmeibacter sp. MSK16QG-6]|uniref:MFS transporter n=1 Tax=Notoacmeibacter sp. MSK16QG-6 TaxID=2957982 RepID=UPI00209F657B|nr:MFS transporter [Notoacmeibacter sp. MSK16QG-6]MCP1199263.1 MFS transporter [Notoacmeibacter sp. MSK16QG-6]